MPKLLIYIAILILTTGCSNKLFTVYKIDVQQGNALSEQDAASITEGMPQGQVLNLLGEPVLNPAFSTDRWDYVFYRKKAYEDAEKLVLSVYFEDGKVSRVDYSPEPE